MDSNNIMAFHFFLFLCFHSNAWNPTQVGTSFGHTEFYPNIFFGL